MKTYILFLSFILCFISNPNGCFGQILNYALIQDDLFYTTRHSEEDSLLIYPFNRMKNDRGLIHSTPILFSGTNEHNRAWSLSGNLFAYISCDISIFRGGDYGYGLRKTYNSGMGIPATDSYLRSYVTLYLRSCRSSLSVLYPQIRKKLSHDVTVKNENLIRYYLRDENALYVYNIPLVDHFRDYVRMSGWEEKSAYTGKSYDKKKWRQKHIGFFLKKKPVINAINDTLFFNGNYKVIDQDENTFIFNLQTGRIYIMRKKKIEHIGTISILDDYTSQQEKKLIIEDRDNNEIILLVPVTWEKTKQPKPRIRTLGEGEMKGIYGGKYNCPVSLRGSRNQFCYLND